MPLFTESPRRRRFPEARFPGVGASRRNSEPLSIGKGRGFRPDPFATPLVCWLTLQPPAIAAPLPPGRGCRGLLDLLGTRRAQYRRKLERGACLTDVPGVRFVLDDTLRVLLGAGVAELQRRHALVGVVALAGDRPDGRDATGRGAVGEPLVDDVLG